jgi:anti-sigma B factor antagonist
LSDQIAPRGNVVNVAADRWRRPVTGPAGTPWWSVCRITDELAIGDAPLVELLAATETFPDHGGALRLAVVGELCVLTTPSLGEALDWVSGTTEGLDIDLSRVTFIDAAGVRLLLRLSARLAERQGQLGLHSPSPIVLLVFAAVELGDRFPAKEPHAQRYGAARGIVSGHRGGAGPSSASGGRRPDRRSRR